jgi:hypothetical protein
LRISHAQKNCDLPPFSAVRSFEAAARHHSLSKAVDELHGHGRI